MPEDPKVTNPPPSASSSDSTHRRRPPAPDPKPGVVSEGDVARLLREMAQQSPQGFVSVEDVTRALRETSEREISEPEVKKAMQRLVGWWPESVELGHEVMTRLAEEHSSQAQQSLFRDIDTILARLESGIAVERAAMDTLLDRLTINAK
jgi:hypothetical protein